jgi:maltose O-acetyltransferase
MNQYGFRKLLGNRGRIGAWRLLGSTIDDDVVIGPGVRIRIPSNVTIGAGTLIAGRAWIDSWAPVRIGRNVLVDDDLMLLTASHFVDSRDFEADIRPISIGDHVWLPVRIIVLPGVTVGEAAVIGSGSVVTHDVPPYSVAAGSPARVRGERARHPYRYVPSRR